MKSAGQYSKEWRKRNPEKVTQANKNWLQVHLGYKKKWSEENKQILHQLKINGCAKCGYNECDAALEFHHANPEDKKYAINRDRICRKDLADELNKCILLCCRCHREIENMEVNKNE